jgi:hypothetical protein
MPKKKPLCRKISPEKPLIVLQTSPRFGDTDNGEPTKAGRAREAARHGKEAVRVWRETVPDDIKPYCQLRIETRSYDHKQRYESFRRIFAEMEKEGIPTSFQFGDPHYKSTFDPDYVEKLIEEFSCIQSLNIAEMRFEHYDTFNVQRYAMCAEARYMIDILEMAARHGKHLMTVLQDLKWMHIGADYLNQPLVDTILANGEYCIPVNEHIGPRHIARQTSIHAWWLAGMTGNWGVCPQAWWFENSRMIQPGVFGQTEPDNTRVMPPDLYRAMILLGAQLGSTVYTFEPFWDLFDYDNSVCWRDHIYPTLMEVIERKLIPTREQVLEKTKVAYLCKEAKTIMEFHENLRDVDWIGDEGLLAKAAYGLWEKYLMHELIPDRCKNYYIPLFPPKTPKEALDKFEHVIRPGECQSVEEYETLLDKYYPAADGEGDAFITTVNGHTYVMQNRENLYERQRYRIELPKPVRGVQARLAKKGIELTWEEDPGASRYHVHRTETTAFDKPFGFSDTIWKIIGKHFDDPELRKHVPKVAHSATTCRSWNPFPEIGHAKATVFVDKTAKPGKTYTYTITATTTSRDWREGTVNYLDYVVFSQRQSMPVEQLTISAQGEVTVRPYGDPEDTRPEKSPDYYPTFDGAESHRAVAREIVAQFEAFKAAFESMDAHGIMTFYSRNYQDPNGWHWEYVARAWKWWFFRLNSTTLLRQIRTWDFSHYAETGEVSVRMFSLYRGCRWDDGHMGYSYDGTVRLPRSRDEEIVYTWLREEDGAWRLIRTNPPMPCFEEMLSFSRGVDKKDAMSPPGVDEY